MIVNHPSYTLKKVPILAPMELPSSPGTQSSSLSVVARCTFQTINIVLVLVSIMGWFKTMTWDNKLGRRIGKMNWDNELG